MSVELGHEYPLPCPGFHAQGLSRGCQEHGLEKDAAPPRALGTSVSDVPFWGLEVTGWFSPCCPSGPSEGRVILRLSLQCFEHRMKQVHSEQMVGLKLDH